MNVPASAPSATTGRRRLLTGDRPTGPLHLGHLVGTLHNRVQMQENHDCWLIVADLHSLTTRSRREQIAVTFAPSTFRKVSMCAPATHPRPTMPMFRSVM